MWGLLQATAKSYAKNQISRAAKEIIARPWEFVSIAHIYVIDGDTITTRVNHPTRSATKRYKIRILGYDAHEIDQPMGQEAANFLHSELSHDHWRLYTRWEKDYYGRTLGHLINSEGVTMAERFTNTPLCKPHEKTYFPNSSPWRRCLRFFST